jgi:YD repeat-containing protein
VDEQGSRGQIERLLLTTDTTYIPIDFGSPETEHTTGITNLEYLVNRIIEYDCDNLYRLTSVNCTSGESYQYSYDPVGNRLQQIIDGETTDYLYDAANRLSRSMDRAPALTPTATC